MSKPILVVVESPKKAKTLTAILGDQYLVKASLGHIRDLPARSMGVAAPDYQPVYVTEDDRAQSAVASLQVAATQCDGVILATDPDREGEAIAWHLAEVLGLKNPRRVTYNSVTADAILKAIQAPRVLDQGLVKAQEARRVLDRLVGYSVSRPLSKRLGVDGLSAGRVQSVALRLVHDRDMAIRSHSSITHFMAELQFNRPGKWTAEWVPPGEKGTLVLDRSLAESASAVRAVRVVSFEEATQQKSPPPPFITTTLQRKAESALKLKPDETMRLAQSLYESGHITYMRTDSPNLSDEAFSQLEELAPSQNWPLVASLRRFTAKSSAQEAHEAIRPSSFAVTSAGSSEQERALYALIWKRAVLSQLIDARFDIRTLTLEQADPSGLKPHIYVARGRRLIEFGWKSFIVDPAEQDGDEKKELAELLNDVPELSDSALISASDGSVLEKKTKAPARFTQGSLIKELERLGIGRPATYSAIVGLILAKGYVNADPKGFLAVSEVGAQIVDSLVGVFDFMDLQYTADLEKSLDEIAEGKSTYLAVVSAAHDRLTMQLRGFAGVQAVLHPCPVCGSATVERVRKSDNKPFRGCRRYPECKGVVSTVAEAEALPKRTPSKPAASGAPRRNRSQ